MYLSYGIYIVQFSIYTVVLSAYKWPLLWFMLVFLIFKIFLYQLQTPNIFMKSFYDKLQTKKPIEKTNMNWTA